MSDVKYRASCDACLKSKVKCSQVKPACARCIQHSQDCVYSRYRKIGRPSYKALASKPGDEKPVQEKTKKQSPVRQTKPKLHDELQQPDHGKDDVVMGESSLPLDNPFLTPTSNFDLIGEQSGHIFETPDMIDWSSMPPIAHSQFDLNVFSSHEMDIEDTNWADLGNAFNLITIPPPLPTPSSHQQMPDPTGHLSHVEPAVDPIIQSETCLFSNSLASSVPSSTDNDSHRSPSTPASSLLSSSHMTSLSSTSQTSHLNPPFVPVSDACVQQPTSPPGRVSHDSSKTASAQFTFSRRSSEAAFGGSCDSQCMRCQVTLNDQLNYLCELQSNESTRATIDVLLNLDDRVRREREKLLHCSVCMGRSRRGQTLMLATVVVGKLLGLFEAECAADRRASSRSSSISRRESSHDRPSSSEASTTTASLSSSGTSSPFPHTMRPLTIGQVQLDEEVKRAFSRQLLRMYLERQKVVVVQLSQLLAEVEKRDVTHRVASDLLADVSSRAECFLGVFALTDGFESISRVHKVIA